MRYVLALFAIFSGAALFACSSAGDDAPPSADASEAPDATEALRRRRSCVPTSCQAHGANCGVIGNGCGGTLDCGTCQAPETCGGGGVSNVCGTPSAPPPTPTPNARVCPAYPAFPDASCTGVPAGVALTASGSITTTAAGQVLDALDISGGVVVAHDNVTLKRSRVRGGGYFIVYVNAGVRGFTVEDSELDGLHAGEVNGEMTMRRSKVHDFVGIVPGANAVYEDNLVYGLAVTGGAHTECFRLQGGQRNVLIRHNTCDMTGASAGTANIFINAYWDQISGVTIDKNQFLGGGSVGYSLYSTSNPDIGMYTTGTIITDNVVSRGVYGNVYPAGSPSFTSIKQFTNNRDLSTNAVIPLPDFVHAQ